MAKRPKEPNHASIVKANLDLLAQLPTFFEIDISEAKSVCWACGAQTKKKTPFRRCHVVPHSKGGSNDPSNYFILCDVCHDDQPDGLPREAQVEWLMNRDGDFIIFLKILSSIFDEVLNLNRPAQREDIYKFMVEMGENKLLEIIKDGYGSAAGWKNGRANFTWFFMMKFREWYQKQAG